MCVCTYIYIYTHILTHRHPQTDCFVLSELFSAVRHAGRSKPGSKPVQLCVRLCFRPLVHQAETLAKGIFKVFLFLETAAAVVCLHFFIPYRLPECSILSKSFCITLAAAGNSFARELNPHGGSIYKISF